MGCDILANWFTALAILSTGMVRGMDSRGGSEAEDDYYTVIWAVESEMAATVIRLTAV